MRSSEEKLLAAGQDEEGEGPGWGRERENSGASGAPGGPEGRVHLVILVPQGDGVFEPIATRAGKQQKQTHHIHTNGEEESWTNYIWNLEKKPKSSVANIS